MKTGLEKGRLYLSMPEYRQRIKKITKFKPFKGTLNLEVKERELEQFLSELRERKIEGFEKGNSVYGSLCLYLVSCNEEKAAIIIPKKTEHPSNIIEVIAPVKLRKELNLKNGDIVKLEGLE